MFPQVYVPPGLCDNDNINNEILIKRKPLVYTRARRAVQKRKKKGWDSTTAITSSSMDSTPADTTYISLSFTPPPPHATQQVK